MGDSPLSSETPVTLLLAAVRAEIEPVVRRLGLKWEGPHAAGTFHGQHVVAALTGVGMQRSRRALDALLHEYNVQRVVHLGFAGGLDPALKAGAVLRIGAVRDEAGHAITLDDQRDATLLTLAHLAATVEQKRALREGTGASVADMETYAVAERLQARQIPLIALRAVSDPADKALPRAALQWIDPEGQVKTSQVVRWLITHPGECFRLWQLGRRTARAANELAKAVERVLRDEAL